MDWLEFACVVARPTTCENVDSVTTHLGYARMKLLQRGREIVWTKQSRTANLEDDL